LPDAGNQAINVLGCLRGALSQLPDFIGDDREAAPGFTGSGGFNGGVERQQVGLVGNFVDQLDNRADFAGLAGKCIDFSGCVGRVTGQLVQVGGNFSGRLAAADRDFCSFDSLDFFIIKQQRHLAQAALRTGEGFAEGSQIAQDGTQCFAFALLARRRLHIAVEPELQAGEFITQCLLAAF